MSKWIQVGDPNQAAGVDRVLLSDGTVWEKVSDDALLGGRVVDSALIFDGCTGDPASAAGQPASGSPCHCEGEES